MLHAKMDSKLQERVEKLQASGQNLTVFPFCGLALTLPRSTQGHWKSREEEFGRALTLNSTAKNLLGRQFALAELQGLGRELPLDAPSVKPSAAMAKSRRGSVM